MKELCNFFQCIDILFFFLLCNFRNVNILTRIVREHFHLYSIGEYVTNKTKMMNYCLSR